MNKALSMEVETTSDEKFRSEVNSSLSNVESLLSSKVGGFQVELSVLLEQLGQILKPEAEGGEEKLLLSLVEKLKNPECAVLGLVLHSLRLA